MINKLKNIMLIKKKSIFDFFSVNTKKRNIIY